MASTAIPALETPAVNAQGEVSLIRLCVLRATYLLIIVGLGVTTVPGMVSHPVTDHGIIAALLGGFWALAFLGLRYPLQMLPLLMFELVWKTIWVVSFGLPAWSAGLLTPVIAEDLKATLMGVILMPLVIPWGYVWHRYVKQPGDRWR